MKRQTVSLCLIARDEEATIGMAIKSVLALVDEVVVVDTGSKDNTRIIAEGYGARVLDVAWSDDFSEVRNAALDEASCDWILVLDANEFLQPIRPVEFQRLLHNPGIAGYRLALQATGQSPAGDQPTAVRLFRNSPKVRYRYPIFEKLHPSLKAWAEENSMIITDSDLVVLSDGENDDHLTRQRELNLRILRKAHLAHPEEPYYPYRLALEGIIQLDDEVLPVAGLNRSLGLLNQAWLQIDKLDRQQKMELDWFPDLGLKVARGLLSLNRIDEAVPVINYIAQLFPKVPAVKLQKAVSEARALEFLPPTKVQENRRQRVDDLAQAFTDLIEQDSESAISREQKRLCQLYPLRYLGELSLLEGKVSQAVGYFERALSLDPEYSFAWLGMAECSRFAGDRKRALKLYLRTVTENQWNYRAWLRGCDLMREMEFHDNASSWWRRVSEKFPEHPLIQAADADDLGRRSALQHQ